MSEPVVVLDAGVLDRSTLDGGFRATLRELVAAGWDVVVPAVVLSEAITGRPEDAPVSQLIRRHGTTVTSEDVARQAGHLRFAALRTGGRHSPSGIDSIVAAHAVQAGAGVVFTTDPSDLRRLLADHPRIVAEKP